MKYEQSQIYQVRTPHIKARTHSHLKTKQLDAKMYVCMYMYVYLIIIQSNIN